MGRTGNRLRLVANQGVFQIEIAPADGSSGVDSDRHETCTPGIFASDDSGHCGAPGDTNRACHSVSVQASWSWRPPLGKKYGGWVASAIAYGKDKGDKWIDLPIYWAGNVMNYRKSSLKQAGFSRVPATTDEFLEYAKATKKNNRPGGFALGAPGGSWHEFVCAESTRDYVGRTINLPHADKPDF
jgi:hypothetical protein